MLDTIVDKLFKDYFEKSIQLEVMTNIQLQNTWQKNQKPKTKQPIIW